MGISLEGFRTCLLGLWWVCFPAHPCAGRGATLAVMTGCFERPSALCSPVCRLTKGARVLCWAVLLGHFPEFHISSGLDVGLEISLELASFGELSASWALLKSCLWRPWRKWCSLRQCLCRRDLWGSFWHWQFTRLLLLWLAYSEFLAPG